MCDCFLQLLLLYQILTLTRAAHSLSLYVSAPLLTLAHNKDAQSSGIHKCQWFDGLRQGFGETPETELLHHPEIITLEETQETASPKCS